MKNDTFEHWLVLSLIVGVMGQAVFMSFSGRLFDMMFDAAHTLKKVSYLFVLTGLLVSMYHLFRQAGEAVDSLDRSARDLRKSKEGLEALTEASVQMTSALELQGVLRTIIDQSTHVVGADRCAVYLVDPKTANAQAVMTRGLSAEYLEETHHLWQKDIRSPEFERGEMLIRMDAVNDPRQQPVRELVIREGIQSLLIVPLRRRGSVIGGVGFYFDETQDFEGERLSLCRAFANQTTTAIENSRAYAEIRVRSERQEALREVTRDLMENLDISEVFSRICKAVCELLDADSTRLFVLDEKSGALVKTESYGKLEGEENSIRKFPRGKGVLYRVVSSLRPVAVAEVLEDPEWMNRAWAEKAGIKSFLGIPLILKDRAVGALNCYTTRRREFLPDEIQLAQDFGDQAAIAIENSRLFSQAQQRATTLAILNEISSAINATLDLDELFRITAQQVKKVVPCNRASLFILDGKKQEISRFSAVDDVEERQPNLPPTNLKGTRFEKILRTLEPVYIPNTREDPHPRSRVLEAEGLRSVINVPIVIREECVGFLNVAAEAVDAFGDEHVQLLRWVADHLGAAINNAELYSQARDAGERLDGFFRNASDGIITFDREGRVTSWNPGAETIYGYTQEEMLGGDILRLYFDPVRDQIERDEAVNKIRLGESVSPIEQVRRRKDGTPIEVSVTLSILKDNIGRIIGSSGVTRDIGIRKRAEEALRKSEETYRTLFEQARDGIEIVDEEGRYVDCNQKACEMTGFTREEMVGKPVADFLDPKDRDSFSQRIDQILQADGLEIYESVNIRKDGVPVDFEISAGVIRLNGRKHALFFLRDITGRKRAEEALRFTRFCLDHAGDAVFWVTSDAGIPYANDAASRLLGYTGDEMLSMNVYDFNAEFPPERWPEHWADLKQRSSYTIESQHTAKDGRTIPVEVTVNHLEFGGREYCVSFVRDITERRKVERMKNEFVSVVSHELRTPLTSLRGSLGLLAGGVAGDLPPKGEQLLRIAVNNTDRLVRLINDILDLEKIEAGKMELRVERCSAEELIHRAIEEMRRLASEHHVRIETALEPCEVEADEDRVVQVLVNLLSNAIKFSDAEGRVLVGIRVRGAEAEIRVEDQGRGIPEAALENVFGKFQQVDASDSRQKGGTGLGLAICQAIIRQHEGRLWVESEEGVGSAFFFTLPRTAPATESPAARTAPAPRPTTGPRVLVCDDDRDYVRMMELFLERAGFGVIPTYSGEEALETLASTEVLAVLLDVGLPRMSGLDVLREIKGRPETASLPVIIISGRSPSEMGEAPTPLVLDWLTKPINEPRLLARLRETLRAGSSPTVLLVDDDEEFLTLLSGLLSREHAGIRVLTATTGKGAIALCRRETPSIMVLDIAMPEGDGFSVIDAMREDPALRKMPVVVYSGMEPSPEQRRRLTLGTTRFLTKSKAKEDDFVAQVVELLNGILPTRDMDLNGG